eukprot:3715008-Prymnesium_polylepis.1
MWGMVQTGAVMWRAMGRKAERLWMEGRWRVRDRFPVPLCVFFFWAWGLKLSTGGPMNEFTGLDSLLWGPAVVGCSRCSLDVPLVWAASK